ncbi:Glycosyltransferase, GT2 family [Nitrosomonas aestuarii]|uniref:Glycosyltransferase, GT2 family n=1 Tax=Nitrosomonas aestuarii TaxID=52441 RepID=A0A1I4CGE6_9PROT|nr:glycosyltransferase family 2 protein [Nitrosomonas aestuarii]SFK79186.1 Glycosyltransferase, GT2 family [Nitrosomonas aestuarii]
MENPFISIIIVNYNSGDMLSRVMSALAVQTYSNYEVVVIDNHSMDNSWQAAEHTSFPCQLVRLEENIGFAAANNLAIADYIQGDWIFLLNPDAYPEPDCLMAVTRNITQMPEIDCFACTLINANLPMQLDGIGDTYHVSGLHWRHGHGSHHAIVPAQPVEVFSACAAAAFYRASTFRQLEGFDESYFAYSEDIDLGFRLRLAGGTCILLPDARVHHVGSAITGRSSDFSIYHGHRNLTWTFIKNMPMPLLFFLLPIHLAMTIYVGLMFALSGRFRPYARAKKDAIRQLGPELAKRRKIQPRRTCSCFNLLRMMCWLPRNRFQK